MGVTVVDTMKKVLAGEKVPQIILTPSVVVTPGEPGRLPGRQALDRAGRRRAGDRQRQADCS